MSNYDAEDLLPDEIRDAKAIAKRALALFGTVRLALGAPRKDVVSWLREEDLWGELSPSELAYVSAHTPSKKQGINASWKSEGLIVLLWALKKIDTLPAPKDQCDTAQFKQILPPYTTVSVAEFISSAERQPDDVVLNMADELMSLHWAARDAQFHGRPIPPHLDIEIIQERHHAINWVIGYGGLPWDEVTTDT